MMLQYTISYFLFNSLLVLKSKAAASHKAATQSTIAFASSKVKVAAKSTATRSVHPKSKLVLQKILNITDTDSEHLVPRSK